ncbi:unnamed protein product [Calicophoron daubneyi]|uniref:SMP-LTD domain-containing protein n=1 Tax=Calicophoron daubneyi TaxID=300641 RepID=A0AAV2T858_CALDB
MPKGVARLPGFMQRSSTPNRASYQLVGSISFSTNQDDDIVGLDEAISLGNRSSPVSMPSSSNLVSNDSHLRESPESGGIPTFEKEKSPPLPEEFEVAVEATTVAEENSRENTEQAVSDSAASGPGIVNVPLLSDSSGLNSETTQSITASKERPLKHETNSSVPEFPSTTNCFESASASSPSSSSKPIPIRPPPFQPHRKIEKSLNWSNVVAAADIHALLDSFSSASKGAVPNDLEKELRQVNMDHLGALSPPKFQIPSEEITSVEFSNAEVRFDNDIDDKTTENDHLLGLVAENIRESGSTNQPERLSKQNKPPISAEPPISPSFVKDPAQSKRVPTDAARKLNRTNKRTRKSTPSSPISTSASSLLICAAILILSAAYFFSTFVWGIAVGATTTTLLFWLYHFLWPTKFDPNNPICPISGLPFRKLCCSLHCPQRGNGSINYHDVWWPIYSPALPPLRTGVPQLRDLKPLTVPHMIDEDSASGTNAGPLGVGLSFKLDKNDRPVYKGWLNETLEYDAETHRISQTHSVFLTLEGSQLRVQRPRRNISRRSMWNEELPSVSATRFQTQRIYDLVHARVSLLPVGLVSKRLWSKKYPICVSIPSQSKAMYCERDRKQSLPSSTSSPNMLYAASSTGNTTNGIDDGGADTNTNEVSGTNAPLKEYPDDDFTLVTYNGAQAETFYLFARTCREKEAWFGRLRAASLGVPLMWTPQLAVQKFLVNTSNGASTNPSIPLDNESDVDNRAEKEFSAEMKLDSTEKNLTTAYPSAFGIPGSREPLYVTYVRYMAKYMPAGWLVRGAQALRLNVNHITCDPNLVWLNAFLGRIFWDFIREVYWLERVRDKIQAKLKKIHLPQFITELIVVGIDLGSELPVIRRIGKPFLDAQGLWFEVDLAYAGGFSVSLETSVNLMRWNQKTRLERESAMLQDDVSASSPPAGSPGVDANLIPTVRRSSRLGAYLSEEEDSADSSSDSDLIADQKPSTSGSSGGLHRGSYSVLPSLIAKTQEDDRAVVADNSVNLPSALTSKKKLIRIVDRITKSSYFQKAVDNKLVQRGMELLSNTPIVLEAEVQMLSGTLMVNIPPPSSDRLWYGFRPNPQLRVKVRPRVGEKAVTMTRILEWIENRIMLEFQACPRIFLSSYHVHGQRKYLQKRVVVLPNMDDVSIPLLLSDVTAGFF